MRVIHSHIHRSIDPVLDLSLDFSWNHDELGNSSMMTTSLLMPFVSMLIPNFCRLLTAMSLKNVSDVSRAGAGSGWVLMYT